MDTSATHLDLVLTRRSADGSIDWTSLEGPQHVDVDAGADYALIDRSNYEAPQTLLARRQGEDLVLEVGGVEVLVLGGFFAAAGAVFYPTTDIAGGAGPFSGSAITRDAAMLPGSPEGQQVVWSADPAFGLEEVAVGASSGAGGSPMLWAGLGVGGLGLALAGAGGGGGGGGGSSGVPASEGGTAGAATTTDDAPPEITSSATATPVDENDGAGRVVYTATANDAGTVSWSLAGDDAEAFSIEAETGVVTLIDDPDYEAKRSYAFTVVATDEAGSRSERAVTLAINDLDENAPTVSEVALTSATGSRSGILNAADTVTVTVTMSEPVDVQASAGTPRIALNLGGSTVYADYVAGSGTASLRFEYTVAQGDTDDNGIAIPRNALELNGGTVADAAGNPAELAHDPVGDNGGYRVDTTAPNLSGSSPADDATDVAVDADIVLTFDEDVRVGSGNITLRSGADTLVIDVRDAAQVSISGNRLTIDPAADLSPGSTYEVQIERGAVTDVAGNPFPGSGDGTAFGFATERDIDATIVVFDLVRGESSDHSGRSFDEDVSYDIYILVESDDNDMRLGSRERWEGAENLGSDDRVILVGDGAPVEGPFSAVNQVSVDAAGVAWESRFGFDAARLEGRTFFRITGLRDGDADDVSLFDSALPAAFLGNQGGELGSMYLTRLPAGILTSQGLV